ncbi:1-(5-phosphoribosyl)-5-[(5-phosphoribosylamino)methylideneamino]imidazole-4-carboxamide isomerase [Arachidicoccus ginsenosidimutans]|uniref:1-(5-phosphoribosyl)-5-[(5- phosphoribosylamino)methylideneamino]imidazole-4- carboxamide isomerase n=1 Tax=Arachidicoccus sp. BS20 TaxID=1850526 RepID=UPI0007F10115|nr:1-(5-phosphoribosyl)-5-[(5-phosphoribosylamino)methylideneamino]imidazole-4-carboxamide isomerase [Arachidicoccus sp. BS20]ANI88938.1 1-(5-phosphoribosyl)-5-[(5-phosphoribosylamino)methylideneamino]imidazole-4-carboxamide isomerase [Arachidicoccus sp. BS20]
MLIIPAIDIIDGKCVRLTQGDYTQKTIYNENPVEVAKSFADAGLRKLHLVDLDGAKAGKIINYKVLENIANAVNMEIDFGGGIKQKEDVELVLNSGAKYATIGSIAVKNEALFSGWIEDFGADRFLLGADVKGEKIAVNGWTETTDIDVFSFIEKYFSKGIKNIFCTDVSKDGLLQGPSIELYKKIITKFPPINFIASGGVSSVDDLLELSKINCFGAIVGKAIYEGRISLKQLSLFRS